ncbi:MAG: hypothetical protein ACO3F9_13965 [Burkholderiales bacterium]
MKLLRFVALLAFIGLRVSGVPDNGATLALLGASFLGQPVGQTIGLS